MSHSVAPEHLLRALIPHAVINHDVTAHLGRKGWIEPVVDPPADCDESRCSVAPWAADSDGFGVARLAALATDLPDAVGCGALAAVAALRMALEEGLGNAAVSAAGDDAATSAVVEGALAWLRSVPVRRPRDLPCLAADHVYLREALTEETAALAAPCVTRVSFCPKLPVVDAVNALQELPHATQVSSTRSFGQRLVDMLDRRVSEKDERAVAVAARLRLVNVCGPARAASARSRKPLFPNVADLTLGSEMEVPDIWRWVARHRALEHLTVEYVSWQRSFGGAEDRYGHDPAAVAERNDAIVAAFAAVGPSLRKLDIHVTNYVDMMTPRIVGSIWDNCFNLRELKLREVGLVSGFFHGVAALPHLQSITLEGVKGSGEDGETADLVALPAALPQLETLRMSDWDIPLPAAFVAALAAHPRLATWEVSSVRFVGRATHSDATELPPFRALRVAKLPADGALPVVALAPNLRLLEFAGDGHSLEGITFASPCASVVMPHYSPTTLLAVLHGSGVFALSGVLASNAAFEAAGSPSLGAFPPTLRHAEFASPGTSTNTCADELTQLLTAARDSNLETLTLLHPPDIDVAAAFSPGGFRRLRSLTVLGASQAWVDSVPVLRLVSSDVVVDRDNTWESMFA